MKAGRPFQHGPRYTIHQRGPHRWAWFIQGWTGDTLRAGQAFGTRSNARQEAKRACKEEWERMGMKYPEDRCKRGSH